MSSWMKKWFENIGSSLFLYVIIIIIIENAIVLYLFCLLFYSFYRETNKLSS